MSKNKTESLSSSLPGFHLASQQLKILNPIALQYIKGSYHLFTKVEDDTNPESALTILHSLSTDLIHWKSQMPLLTFPFQYKDATLVNDTKNVSGLGGGSKAPLLMYLSTNGNTSQFYLFYSNDHGVKWTPFQKNAVLDIKRGGGKSPFVFWHEASARWILMVTVPSEYKILFYSSKNLIKWEFVNDFGGHPSFKQKWDYASLAPIQVVNVSGKTKWVLLVSTQGEYSAARYFVGEFDGKSFLCDHALDNLLYIDHGKDYYAPQPCIGSFPKRNLLVSRAMNEAYIDSEPTKGWKGMITAAKEFNLTKEADGSFKMIQQFAPELKALREKQFTYSKSPVVTELEWDIEISSYMEFDIKLDSNKGCSLEFDFGNKTKLLLTWDVPKHQIILDRTARPLGFHALYSTLETASVISGHVINFHIVLDKYSIEILADNGKASITSSFFAMNDLQRFRIIGKQFAASGDVWILKG